MGPDVFDRLDEAKRDVELPEYLANSRFHKARPLPSCRLSASFNCPQQAWPPLVDRPRRLSSLQRPCSCSLVPPLFAVALPGFDRRARLEQGS